MPWWRIAFYTSVIVAVGLWLEPDTLAPQPRFPDHDHAIHSLGLAISSMLCNRPSMLSQLYIPGRFLIANQSATVLPLRTVVTQIAGSPERYCSSVTVPHLNDDNSLSLIETLVIAIRPTVSARTIACVLTALKLIVVALMCALVLRLGGSVALSAVCTIACIAVLRELLDEGWAYSAYSFLFVLVLLNAILCSAALKVAADRSRWSVAAQVAAGFVAAFSTNMRSSYLPIFVAFELACLVSVLCLTPSKRRSAVTAAAAFAAGYLLFQYPFINRRIPEVANNHSFHSISHPLVLSLALPPNDLAEHWLDGFLVANQIVVNDENDAEPGKSERLEFG